MFVILFTGGVVVVSQKALRQTPPRSRHPQEQTPPRPDHPPDQIYHPLPPGFPGGVFARGDLPRWGCVCLGEVCLPGGGGVCPGWCASEHAMGQTLPLWAEFLTHACENITFLQLLLWTVKNQLHGNKWGCSHLNNFGSFMGLNGL